MTETQTTAARGWRPRWAHVALAASVVIAAAALTIAAARDSAGAAPQVGCDGSPRLTVQGAGQASATPDSLNFNAQISVNASSAQEALAEDNTTTRSVVQAIEAAGVKAADVQTTDFSINPNYTYTDGQSIISGYGVSNSLGVTVRKIADAGTIIDAATTAGGNALSVGSLNFAQTDPRRLEDRARRDAVRQAVTHAGAMARAAGQRLGPVCSLTDNSGVTGPLPVFGPMTKAASADAVPLEGGTQQASAQVTLVYQLEPNRD
jgi:uncharacterized protein YggE